MVKVLKTSQGKVLTLNGDVLTTNAIVPTGTLNITENDTYDVTNYASAVVSVQGGGDIIEAINNTGATISADDKVYIAPLATPQSGANYEIVPVKTTDTPSYGFWSKGDVSVDLTNKEASSFSQYNYLEVPMVFDYTQPWEFNICLQTGSSISSTQIIYFGSVSTFNDGGVLLYIDENKFNICITDGYTANYILYVNNYPVSANTTYYVRIGWTGTEYYIRYSINGTDWTSETPVTSSVQAFQSCSSMRIGSRANNSSSFQGKVFLDKTYFISNGEVVWQALYDGTWSNIGKDVVTGIANESIASGSVGEVTTLLGE